MNHNVLLMSKIGSQQSVLIRTTKCCRLIRTKMTFNTGYLFVYRQMISESVVQIKQMLVKVVKSRVGTLLKRLRERFHVESSNYWFERSGHRNHIFCKDLMFSSSSLITQGNYKNVFSLNFPIINSFENFSAKMFHQLVPLCNFCANTRGFAIRKC